MGARPAGSDSVTKLNANTAPDVTVIEVHEGHGYFLSAMTLEVDHLDAEAGSGWAGWAHWEFALNTSVTGPHFAAQAVSGGNGAPRLHCDAAGSSNICSNLPEGEGSFSARSLGFSFMTSPSTRAR